MHVQIGRCDFSHASGTCMGCVSGVILSCFRYDDLDISTDICWCSYFAALENCMLLTPSPGRHKYNS